LRGSAQLIVTIALDAMARSLLNATHCLRRRWRRIYVSLVSDARSLG
jgi:hypothetical protein